MLAMISSGLGGANALGRGKTRAIADMALRCEGFSGVDIPWGYEGGTRSWVPALAGAHTAYKLSSTGAHLRGLSGAAAEGNPAGGSWGGYGLGTPRLVGAGGITA